MVDRVFSPDKTICALGDGFQCGTYILRIELVESSEIIFGKFNNKKSIFLPKGHYVYIGSALSKKGATSLGNRLSRHAARSPPHPSHEIRQPLRSFFDQIGISYTNSPSPKKLFWNIDHLLDTRISEIRNIVFIRSDKPLENTWSKHVESFAETEILEKGLGANDSVGHTHLQKIVDNAGFWEHLMNTLPLNTV